MAKNGLTTLTPLSEDSIIRTSPQEAEVTNG